MINLLLLGGLNGFKFVSEGLVSWAKLDSLLYISHGPFKFFGRLFGLSTEEVSLGSLLINVESLSGLANRGRVIT